MPLVVQVEKPAWSRIEGIFLGILQQLWPSQLIYHHLRIAPSLILLHLLRAHLEKVILLWKMFKAFITVLQQKCQLSAQVMTTADLECFLPAGWSQQRDNQSSINNYFFEKERKYSLPLRVFPDIVNRAEEMEGCLPLWKIWIPSVLEHRRKGILLDEILNCPPLSCAASKNKIHTWHAFILNFQTAACPFV